MQSFLVFWRGCDLVLQTEVTLPETVNPATLSPTDWARLASEAEGNDPEEIEDGFDLYAVLKYPVEFVY